MALALGEAPLFYRWYCVRFVHNKYTALTDKNVWEVVLPPPDTNIVKSHWTYICKTNRDGATRPKSQVMAQGFTQTFGIDYDETYAPVTPLMSLPTICAIATRNNWLVHRIEVNNLGLSCRIKKREIEKLARTC